MKPSAKRYFLVAFGVGCLALRTHAASTPALSTDTSAAYRSDLVGNTNGMYGWSFWVLEPIVVTALGWYDEGRNGLFQEHEVGLWWSSSHVPATNYFISSLSIPSGSEAVLDGVYRKVDFAKPVTLDVGLYAIGGTYSFESEDLVKYGRADGPEDFSQDPRISLQFPALAIGGGFRFPDVWILGSAANLGPMFYIESVPEPSSVALWLLGWFLSWRRCSTVFHHSRSHPEEPKCKCL